MKKILVFITKNEVSAVKVAKTTEPIGFNGDNSLEYNDAEKLKDFRMCLLSEFAFRTFADDEFDIIIVNCGAEKNSVDCLYDLCRDAAKVNVVSIEKVLPLVALNRGLGKNETKVFSFGDLSWTVESHAEDKSVTVQDADGAEGVELEPEDFCLLYEFRAMVQSDEEEIARIKAECQSKIKEKEEEFQQNSLQLDNDRRKFSNRLDALSNVALTQEDLDGLSGKEVKEICLCGGEFVIPLDKGNVTYVGIGNAKAVIKSVKRIDFEKLGVEFVNLKFDEKYTNSFLSKKVGDIVKMGTWQGENVEWLILDVKDDRILLLSRYGIDSQPYQSGWGGLSWENSTLRMWLNTVFYEQCFSHREQMMIQPTDVLDYAIRYVPEEVLEKDCPWNSEESLLSELEFKYPGEKLSCDRIFLLHGNEVQHYMGKDYERVCKVTKYIEGIKNTSSRGANGYYNWWLRDSDWNGKAEATFVCDDGGISQYCSEKGGDNYHVVRPAMWVKI